MFRYLKRIVARRKGPDVPGRVPTTPRGTFRQHAVAPWRINNHLIEFGLAFGGVAHADSMGLRTMSPHRVSVLLNQGEVYARPGEGYEPLSGYVRAIDFDVDAISAGAACEVAYGVTNSYPGELHCDAKYLDVVRTYREVGHFRSVTVGDMFVVDEERFVCSHFGFSWSPGMNGISLTPQSGAARKVDRLTRAPWVARII